MEHRLLGHGALRVSAIGLGCMSMSGTYGKSDDAGSIAVIHRALDLGVDFLDSSDMYGWGHNEELVRRALAGRRLASSSPPSSGRCGARTARQPRGRGPGYVRSACEASLSGWVWRRSTSTTSTAWTPRSRSRRRWGHGAASRGGEDPGTRALRDGPVHPSPGARRPSDRRSADGVLAPVPAAGRGRPRGVPGARGRLRRVLAARGGGCPGRSSVPTTSPPTTAGASTEVPGSESRAQRAAREAPGRDRAGQGRDPRPLALAWLLARGQDIVPIPGTKQVDRLEENVGATGSIWTRATSTRSTKRCPRGPARGPDTRSPR